MVFVYEVVIWRWWRVTSCMGAQTWPGTTALENSLFSWTSLLGVVSNLSAMLFNVSLDSTWTTKEKEKKQKSQSRSTVPLKLWRGDRMMRRDGTTCSVLLLVEKELCYRAKTSRTTSIWRQKWRDIFQRMTHFPGSQSSFIDLHILALRFHIPLWHESNPVSKQWQCCSQSVLCCRLYQQPVCWYKPDLQADHFWH